MFQQLVPTNVLDTGLAISESVTALMDIKETIVQKVNMFEFLNFIRFYPIFLNFIN